MTHVRPASPEAVAQAVAAAVAGMPGRVRLAIDGADAAAPDEVAERVALAVAPRSALHVRARDFLRAQSLRFELGRTDPDMWLDHWLDEGALRREVLDSAALDGRVLVALRDPGTDRPVRQPPAQLPESAVVIVSGPALLGRGLPFDLTVHLQLTPSALARRTPDEHAWTLSALARYEREVDPVGIADIVVRSDDPRHPAIVVS